jgi:hypothetical protein
MKNYIFAIAATMLSVSFAHAGGGVVDSDQAHQKLERLVSSDARINKLVSNMKRQVTCGLTTVYAKSGTADTHTFEANFVCGNGGNTEDQEVVVVRGELFVNGRNGNMSIMARQVNLIDAPMVGE